MGPLQPGRTPVTPPALSWAQKPAEILDSMWYNRGQGQNRRPCAESYRETYDIRVAARDQGSLVNSGKSSVWLSARRVAGALRSRVWAQPQVPEVPLAIHCKSCRGEVGRDHATTHRLIRTPSSTGAGGRLGYPVPFALPHCGQLRTATIPSDSQASSMRTNHMRLSNLSIPSPTWEAVQITALQKDRTADRSDHGISVIPHHGGQGSVQGKGWRNEIHSLSLDFTM